MKILNALKGISGQYEVQRTLGAAGTLVYVITAPLLIAAGYIHSVSFTEYCLAYPSGIAACIGATAGSIALKDRSVAKAMAATPDSSTT